MRLLHLADLHLDTLFVSRSAELRDRLREASREALRRAVDLAIRRHVDGVLVAGDLFDGTRLSYGTERFLVDQVQRLAAAGIPFLYATGNHDPGEGIAGSGRIPWPANVELFADGEPRTVLLRREGRPVGTVTAAGHVTDREGADLAARFPARRGGGEGIPEHAASLPAVAMLHTQVTGAGGAGEHDRYAPSELPALRNAGYDYWALGHIHLREALEAFPGIHYPGNLQGRSPRETGAKGGLLVELPEAGAAPRVEFVALAPIRWERLTVDGLEESRTFDHVLARVETRWRDARQDDPGLPGTAWIVRVELRGATPLAEELTASGARGAFAAEISRRLDLLEAELRTEGVRSPVDPAEYRDRMDPAGSALRLLADIDSAEGAARLVAHLSIDAGTLAGFRESGEHDTGAYFARLLGGGIGERMLVDRFRREGEGS